MAGKFEKKKEPAPGRQPKARQPERVENPITPMEDELFNFMDDTFDPMEESTARPMAEEPVQPVVETPVNPVGKAPSQGKSKPASGGKSGKILLIVLCAVLGLLVVAIAAGVIYYNVTLNKMNKVSVPKINYTTSATEYAELTMPTEAAETTEATTEATTEPTEPHVASKEDYINVLVIGQDARDGEANHLADSMILCTINTYEKTLTLTSIFRDTQLQVGTSYTDTKGGKHTSGRVKINMIYASGYTYGYGTADAMGWMNQVMYDNFGIEVDHNFEINFDLFMDMVNAVGGVDIEINEAEAAYLNEDSLWVRSEMSAGVAHMDGMTALSYVRMRHADGDQGDISRTVRQRKFIAAVLEKLKTMDLTTVQKVIDSVLPNITTSMSNSEITALITKLLPMLPSLELKESGTCPQSGAYWGAMVDIFGNGIEHSVLQFNPQTVKMYMRALTLGEGTIE